MGSTMKQFHFKADVVFEADNIDDAMFKIAAHFLVHGNEEPMPIPFTHKPLEFQRMCDTISIAPVKP